MTHGRPDIFKDSGEEHYNPDAVLQDRDGPAFNEACPVCGETMEFVKERLICPVCNSEDIVNPEGAVS